MPNSNPKPLTIYTARCRGKANNADYPDRHLVTSAEDLRQAVAFDHVCAEYEGNHRSNRNFLRADCLPLDLDNGHSDRPEDWKTLEDIRAAFPGVPFYAVPSRNHMKVKAGKAARPKYHVYFPIDAAEAVNWPTYRKIKEKALGRFPWFDNGAKDAARFLYGVDAPEVITVQGDEGMTLTAFLGALGAPAADDGALDWESIINDARAATGRVIPAGQRNSTLSHLAGQLLKRYGAEDGTARAEYDKAAARCDPPLEADEVETIWNSAVQFYQRVVTRAPDYLLPEQYAVQDFAQELFPKDFSDVGQAEILAALYGDRLRYSRPTDWMIYDGTRWTENLEKARGLVHQLTKRQLKEARRRAAQASDALLKAAEDHDEDAMKKAQADKDRAQSLHKFVCAYRRSARISATLTEAAPYMSVNVDDLDKDAFLLNTPAGSVDLRTGEMKAHDPKDYCTRLTGCAPGGEGAEIFAEFLDKVACGDRQLVEYLQLIAGMFAVGAVFRECLIIAYGGGGNGKSTFFNLLAYVLGDYAGNLSAETLTMNCRKNKSPEYAELRGKRLVIAAELEEGMRFDTAAVKKLCSTDPIYAEKKFKDPFAFTPSHTMVLYTNHLPKVGTVDRGTWDRLIVVPFNARFRGQAGEVLNYARYLFEHAGGAVLRWVIDGARRFIEARFRIDLPDCVQAAIDEYRADNDWIQQFLETCCDVAPQYRQPSGTLYAYYRQYCAQIGEYTRHPADFKRGMLDNGFGCRKGKTGVNYYGLRLKPSVLGYTTDLVPAADPPE